MLILKKQLAVYSPQLRVHQSDSFSTLNDSCGTQWKNNLEAERSHTQLTLRKQTQRLNTLHRQLTTLTKCPQSQHHAHPDLYSALDDIASLITHVDMLHQRSHGQKANIADIRTELGHLHQKMDAINQHLPVPKLIVNTDIILPKDRIVRKIDEITLAACLKNPNTRIVEIAVMGGSGKSCFTREFLLSHEQRHGLIYQQQIWFSFYTLKSRDIMAPFEALLDMIINEARLWPNKDTIESKRHCVQQYLNTTHTLMVLDGLEIAQKGDITQDEGAKHVNTDDVGRFKDSEFAKFMIALTHNTKSHVLVSSRVPLRDLRDGNNAAGEGLVVFELPQWRDDEVVDYLLSGNGVSGTNTQVMPVVGVLGRHPLTLSLFKGMLQKRYGGRWEKADFIIKKLARLMNLERDEGTIYDKQLKRIRGILGEMRRHLKPHHRRLLERLSGMYGELRESHYPLLVVQHLSELKDRREVLTDKAIDYLDELRVYNLLIEGHSHGERNVTAHPMVKLGLIGWLNKDAQMGVHETLMAYFQAQPIAEILDREEQFDELMEWSHQVVTLMRMDGAFKLCSKDWRLKRLKRSALYEQMRGVMGRYISERGISYLQQEVFLAEPSMEGGKTVSTIPNTEKTMTTTTLHPPSITMTIPVTEPIKRPSIMNQMKAFFGLENQSQSLDLCSSSMPLLKLKKGRSCYEAGLKALAEKIDQNVRDVNVFQTNMSVVDQMTTLIRSAEVEEIQLKEPAVIVRTVFYGMYLTTIAAAIEAKPMDVVSDTKIRNIRKMMNRNVVGVEEWQELFGADAIDVSEVPELPERILEVLTSRCPMYPETSKRVYETHMLYLMPKTVKGTPLTMMEWDRLLNRKIANSPFRDECKYYDTWYKDDAFANEGVDCSRWILMPKEVLPGSVKKNYNAQKAYFDHQKQRCEGMEGYEIIRAVELTTGIFLRYLITEDRLYKELRFGRTRDMSNENTPVYIGYFNSMGLNASSDEFSYSYIGLSVCRYIAFSVPPF